MNLRRVPLKLSFLCCFCALACFPLSAAESKTAAPAKAEAAPTDKIPSPPPAAAKPAATQAPAQPAPAQKEQPKSSNAVAPSTAAPAPAAAAAPAKAPPADLKPENLGFVSPLRDLVKFYEGEIGKTHKMMESWAARVRSSLDQLASLTAQAEDMEKQITAKEQSDKKEDRREASRLKKDLKRLRKAEKAVRKDLRHECAEFLDEVKAAGKETSAALKDKFQQVQQDIKGAGQGN